MLVSRYAFKDAGYEQKKCDYLMKHLRDNCSTYRTLMKQVPMITRHGIATTAIYPIVHVELEEALIVASEMIGRKISDARRANWLNIYNVLKGLQ